MLLHQASFQLASVLCSHKFLCTSIWILKWASEITNFKHFKCICQASTPNKDPLLTDFLCPCSTNSLHPLLNFLEGILWSWWLCSASGQRLCIISSPALWRFGTNKKKKKSKKPLKQSRAVLWFLQSYFPLGAARGSPTKGERRSLCSKASLILHCKGVSGTTRS